MTAMRTSLVEDQRSTPGSKRNYVRTVHSLLQKLPERPFQPG